MDLVQQSTLTKTTTYTFKNIFQDAAMFILREVLNLAEDEVQLLYQNENITKIKILLPQNRNIELTILQFQKIIIFLIVEKERKPEEIRFITSSYLKEQVSNLYRTPKYLKELEHLFNPKTFLSFQKVLQLRLNNFIEGRNRTLDILIDFKIMVFLDEQSLFKLFFVNHQTALRIKDQNFWFQLYLYRYGRNGFELKNLNWMMVYVKQIKQKRKWIKL